MPTVCESSIFVSDVFSSLSISFMISDTVVIDGMFVVSLPSGDATNAVVTIVVEDWELCVFETGDSKMI